MLVSVKSSSIVSDIHELFAGTRRHFGLCGCQLWAAPSDDSSAQAPEESAKPKYAEVIFCNFPFLSDFGVSYGVSNGA